MPSEMHCTGAWSGCGGKRLVMDARVSPLCQRHLMVRCCMEWGVHALSSPVPQFGVGKWREMIEAYPALARHGAAPLWAFRAAPLKCSPCHTHIRLNPIHNLLPYHIRYKDTDVRVHASRLLGTQSLARHGGWKGGRRMLCICRTKSGSACCAHSVHLCVRCALLLSLSPRRTGLHATALPSATRTGDRQAVEAERSKHLRIANELGCLKNGVLVEVRASQSRLWFCICLAYEQADNAMHSPCTFSLRALWVKPA